MASTSKPGLAGNCDYWHLDYVLLDQGRSVVGTPESRDVAFVAPAPSMLAHYQAMPARQYRQSDMAGTLAMTITNLFRSAVGHTILCRGWTTRATRSTAMTAAMRMRRRSCPTASYQTAAAHATPRWGMLSRRGRLPGTYTVVHTVREGVGGDDYGDNDTVRFSQVFADYYAYDDGTAENGYGLTSTASRVYLAYRFDLNVEDTLTAVDIYFNRTLGGENEQVPFYITVWRWRRRAAGGGALS